jgi:hypothetical protein
MERMKTGQNRKTRYGSRPAAVLMPVLLPTLVDVVAHGYAGGRIADCPPQSMGVGEKCA